jgi:NAD(P)-dependent dehydrogenase (short-subunit alcohol dehydrogenase family)
VIVTGASKGIRKGIVKVFSQNGGKVLVVSRNLEEAEACAEELRHAGGAAKGHAADVTKMRDMHWRQGLLTAIAGGWKVAMLLGPRVARSAIYPGSFAGS